MMNLEETIQYYEERAEAEERRAKLHLRPNRDVKGSGKRYLSWLKCAKEHRQIAEWLRELKQRHDYENGCQYCKYKFRSDEDEPCVICSHNYTDKFKDDGTREVNSDEDKTRV